MERGRDNYNFESGFLRFIDPKPKIKSFLFFFSFFFPFLFFLSTCFVVRKRPLNEKHTTLRKERDEVYSHRAASKTAIDRLERSIEMMGTMPEQIAEAHVRFMGYDLPETARLR